LYVGDSQAESIIPETHLRAIYLEVAFIQVYQSLLEWFVNVSALFSFKNKIFHKG